MGNTYNCVKHQAKSREPMPRDECTAAAAAKYVYLHPSKSYMRKDLISLISLDENEAREGDTALHDAVRLNHLDMVVAVLGQSPDVNLSSRNGDTPLHLAAESGHKDIAEMLINRGATVNAKNRYDETPLHMAAKFGWTELVTLLLERGANANEKNSRLRKLKVMTKKQNALHMAARFGHTEVITLLLKLRADVNAKDSLQRNPLHLAARHGHVKAIEVLLKYKEVSRLTSQIVIDENGKPNNENRPTKLEKSQDWRKLNPFQDAIYSHQPDSVEFLLKRNVQLDSLDASDHYAFHNALRKTRDKRSHERERVMEILLKSSIFNINAIDESAQTPLHCAMNMCEWRHHEDTDETCHMKAERKHSADNIVELLLNNGANINQRSCTGETALMIAAERGCDHFIQILLDWNSKNEHKLLLDLRDERGQTALMRAVVKRHVHVVELLVTNRASVNVYDNRGFTPLHAAIFDPYLYWTDADYICSELRKRMFDLHDFDGDSVDLDHIVKVLDDNEAKDKKTKEKILRVILSNDTSVVNALDFTGKTSLDLAQQLSTRIGVSAMEVLDTHGAVTNNSRHQRKSDANNVDLICKCQTLVIDGIGRTPLHRAVLMRFQPLSPSGFDEWYNLLPKVLKMALKNIKHLAKMADYKGRTAVHYAVINKPIQKHGFHDRVALLRTMFSKIDVDINAPDIHGRTPLHYAAEDDVYSFLIKEGASERVKDKFGHTPKRLRKLRKRMEELCRPYNSIPFQKEHIGQIHLRVTDRMKLVQLDQITKGIERLVDRISSAIGERDHRFTCRPTLFGSASDGTKMKIPGDFDFDLTLTELSKHCEICPCPVIPSGYVQLKRKILDPEEIDCFYKSGSDFATFFNRNNLLLVNEVNLRFKIILNDILLDPDFWINEDTFELHESFYNSDKDDTMIMEHPLRLCSSVKLTMIRPLCGKEEDLYFSELSLDLVPCIHIQNWWPDEALHSAKDEYKSLGCNVVFDSPQRYYPWVPFAETYARISFSQTESHIIKNCSGLSKVAYLTAREISKGKRNEFLTLYNAYILKTSFLYCIEAFDVPWSVQVSDELSKTSEPTEIDFWVERILFCFAEFCDQDFLPNFFMPPFSLPTLNKVKFSHISSFLRYGTDAKYLSKGHALYWKHFPDSDETDFNNYPTVQPLWEHFDREAFIRKLRNFNHQKERLMPHVGLSSRN